MRPSLWRYSMYTTTSRSLTDDNRLRLCSTGNVGWEVRSEKRGVKLQYNMCGLHALVMLSGAPRGVNELCAKYASSGCKYYEKLQVLCSGAVITPIMNH